MTRDLGHAPRSRCLLVWLVVTLGVATLVALQLPELRLVRGDRFDVLLVAACRVALLAVAGWLWLATTVVVRDAWRGVGGDRRGVPAHLRRVLLAACGTALVGSLAAPSLAASAHADPHRSPDDGRPAVSVLQGLPLPERTSAASAVALLVAETGAASVATDPERHHPATPRRNVVVAPGDTLWALAAATLPPGASIAEVAHEVQRLHSLNRTVVGDDPDLIRPGQVLRLPATRSSS